MTEVEAVIRAMHPLATRFALVKVREDVHPYGPEVWYANKTRGLRVLVDWSDFAPHLTLFQLDRGRFPRDRPRTLEYEPLHAFDVNTLLLLRSAEPGPVGKMVRRREPADIEALLSEYSAVLETYAADVLSGDFSVFPELNRITEERYKEIRRRC